MSDRTERAVELLIDAAQNEMSFSGWLGMVLATVVARRGGWKYMERTPRTWQASLVWQLLMRSAVLSALDEMTGEIPLTD